MENRRRGAAEAITNDHSMGEPEELKESTSEVGMLETLKVRERASPAGTNYSMKGISESDWKKILQSGKSAATNYSLEGVKEEDWEKAIGGDRGRPNTLLLQHGG